MYISPMSVCCFTALPYVPRRCRFVFAEITAYSSRRVAQLAVRPSTSMRRYPDRRRQAGRWRYGGWYRVSRRCCRRLGPSTEAARVLRARR